jgi:hypothetical protein
MTYDLQSTAYDLPHTAYDLQYMCCTLWGRCTRQVVTALPQDSGGHFEATCAGCGETVYGLVDEDCRQVRLERVPESGWK